MAYRVFVGPKESRVYYVTVRTKAQAVSALLAYLNSRHFHMPECREETGRAECILLAEKERILRERFKPMASGLHGPVYSFQLGSICK